MKVYFDANFSPYLAQALDLLEKTNAEFGPLLYRRAHTRRGDTEDREKRAPSVDEAR